LKQLDDIDVLDTKSSPQLDGIRPNWFESYNKTYGHYTTKLTAFVFSQISMRYGTFVIEVHVHLVISVSVFLIVSMIIYL
jgi:large-conductance mechanosensitive channel